VVVASRFGPGEKAAVCFPALSPSSIDAHSSEETVHVVETLVPNFEQRLVVRAAHEPLAIGDADWSELLRFGAYDAVLGHL